MFNNSLFYELVYLVNIFAFHFAQQNYVKNQWVKEVTVAEPYTEGCIKNKDDGSEYCHCRGDLCNSAPKIDSKTALSNGVDTMGVLIVFNLVKYFRNMDYY